MATEKKITSRIQQKHDVAANWAKATNFIPKKGEIIIYDAEYNASGEETQAVRFKIGDGTKTVVNLPFAVIDYKNEISNLETSLGEAEQDIADNSTAIGKIQGAFESNGTTVKKATSAGKADKVANGLALQGSGSYELNKIVFDGSGQQSLVFGAGLITTYAAGETNQLYVDMQDSGVTSGTYNKVTVNKKGNVTAGENVDYALKTDIPTIPTNYVTTDSEQEISALKTFTSAQGVGSYQGAFRVFVSKEEMDNYYAKFATGDSTSTDITFTSMTNKAFLARTNNANRTAYKDAGIDVWKPSGKYSFLFPEKSGTLAMTTDVEGKANLTGGNTFKGEQSVTRDEAGPLLSVTNTAGDTFFQIHQGANGEEGNIFIGTDTAQAPISLDGSFGLEGQVFTSRGSEHTPQWTNLTYDSLSRIKKQGYAGDNNAVQYFKLATFPEYNSSGNYASFIVTGRMGGWEAGNMSFVNMILYNRGAEGGGYINVDNSSFYNLCDVVMYRETSGASTAYLKVKSYYTFDINVNSFQATNAYTGAAVTPTGTLKWTASTQADRLAVSDGVAYVNGFTLPKQVQINGTTVNPNSAGLINLGSGFATTDKLPTFSLSGTTLTITL